MLMELILMISVETRATVANILRQINDLQPLMEASKSNIEVFNTKVELLISALRARSQLIPNLLTTLFTAYKSCADTTFVKYIARKEEAYEDGTTTISDAQLMQQALEKYKNLTERGDWLKKTDSELQFIAMSNEIKVLKQTPPKTPKTDTGKGKGKGKDGKSPRNVGKYAWKGIAPQNGQAHEKSMDGKIYIYCPHHGETKWVLKVNQQNIEHKTGCRMMAAALAAQGATGTTGVDQLVAAVADITVEDDEEQI
jgi:hypothetical protein